MLYNTYSKPKPHQGHTITPAAADADAPAAARSVHSLRKWDIHVDLMSCLHFKQIKSVFESVNLLINIGLIPGFCRYVCIC